MDDWMIPKIYLVKTMSNKVSYTHEQLKSIQILTSDYDGTLRKNDVIDPRDFKSIAKFRQAGHLIGIITGRAYNMITNKLNHHKVVGDFLICNNGSVIYDA